VVLYEEEKEQKSEETFSPDSLGKWTYKSPVFLGENQEFSIFWPKIEPFSL
jgi:hypothetical protein